MTRPLLAALAAFLLTPIVAALVVHPDAPYVLYRWSIRHQLDAVDPEADTLLLGASVLARWPERSPDTYGLFGAGVQNLAKPGMRAADLAGNLPLRTTTRRIVLDIGNGDLRHDHRPPLDVAVDVAAIVESLVASTDAHVWVLAILPTPGQEDEVEATNTWTASLLAGYRPDRVTWVDVYVPLGPETMRADGYHPNAEGYRQLGEQIREALAQDSGFVAVSP